MYDRLVCNEIYQAEHYRLVVLVHMSSYFRLYLPDPVRPRFRVRTLLLVRHRKAGGGPLAVLRQDSGFLNRGSIGAGKSHLRGLKTQEYGGSARGSTRVPLTPPGYLS